MAQHDKTRVKLHFCALVVEALGTVFIFLDTLRLNARTPPDAFTIGDPVEYRAWFYHSAVLGFGLLFFGILVAGFCLWLEHASFASERPKPRPD